MKDYSRDMSPQNTKKLYQNMVQPFSDMLPSIIFPFSEILRPLPLQKNDPPPLPQHQPHPHYPLSFNTDTTILFSLAPFTFLLFATSCTMEKYLE